MQQITITLVSAEGAVTKKTMVKLPGQPVQVAVPAGTKVAVDVQGPLAGKIQPAQQGAKPDLKFKQVGQDLIIEGDGEKLVELTNFYATPNTTLGVVGWDYAEPVVDAAAATSIEGKAAADQAAVGVSGTGAASEASGFLPAMGWGPVALGGVAVAAIASGGGGSSLPVPDGTTGNILSGVVTGGPLINGHGLSLTLYKSDGTVLKSGVQLTVGPNGGTYSVDLGTYTGAVTARVVDASGDPDYQREDTGASKDLNANLLAMGKATGSPATLNVNAVTTLAALKVLGVNDGSTVATDGALGTAITNAGGTTLDTDTKIADANTAVGKALGLTAIDATVPSVTTNGTLDGNSASGKLGAMLAVLAGVDAINTDNSQTTINTLLSQITQTGATGTLNAAGQASLLAGAIKADAATTGGVLVDVLSTVLAAVYSDAALTVGEITADNILLATELTGGAYTITGTCASGTTPFTLSLNGTPAGGTVTVTGTTWSYVMTGAEVTALGTDGAKYISATAAGKTATRVFELNATNDAPSGVLFTPVLTTINESATATTRTKVATVKVADDGLGAADLSATLSGADAASFELVSTGVGTADLFLKAGLTLDRETKGSYTVTIAATGDGTGSLGSGTFILNVGNVNDAPAGADSAITINEDTSKTLAAADFGFVSGDANDAQFLKAVIITTLPTAGTLKLSGVAVTLNQSISKADIDAGNLVFAPALNANGNAYAAIGFKVQDDGGTANGGVDTSASANTLTINVTAVNDAPTLATPSAIALTDTAAKDTFANQTGTLAGSDVDTGTSLTYGINTGTAGGSTVINTVTYDVSKVGTYGTLYVKSADGSYVYVPNATAINALTANQTETFTVTTSDGALSGSATLTVNVTGADDAPVLASGFNTDGTPSTGDDDYIQLVVGQALSGATLATDFVDPDTGDAAPVFELRSVNGVAATSNTFHGITFNANGTVTGTPTEEVGQTYPRDYTVVIRAKDASNPSLYTDHTYVIHALKAPVIQSFAVADTTTTNGASLGKSGETLDVAVVFSEVVDVTGSPTLTLSINGQSVIATYASGSGASDKTLHFTATVPAGSGADGTNISISSVTANTVTNSIIGRDSIQPWDTTPMPSAYTGYRVDNTAPSITGSYNVNENTSTDTTNHTVQLVATDNSAVTWSTTLGGADAAKFTLSASGLLSFVGNSNFEAKDDTGADGVYDITVTATDAVGKVTNQAVTINLQNVNETPTLAAGYNGGGTAGKDDYLTFALGVVQNNTAMQNDFTDPDGAGALGSPALTYSLASGTMPAGLTLNADGSITGTATAAAGDYTVHVRVTDHGVTGDTASKTLDHDYTFHLVDAPTLSTTLGVDATQKLDVTSNIVLTVDQDVSAVAGKFITITNTAGNGYRGENSQHNFTIEATDSRVHIDNVHHTVWIDPDTNFDLDLSNSYTVTVDAGAFKNSGTNLANSQFAFGFSTVTPGALTGSGTAYTSTDTAQAYMMDITNGQMVAGNRWLDIEGYGLGANATTATDGAARVTIDSTKNFTFVFADVEPAGTSSGLYTATDFNVSLDGFKATDRVYIDDRGNNVAQQNDLGAGDWFGNGNGAVGTELKMGLSTSGGNPSLFVQLANGVTSSSSILHDVDQSLGLTNAASLDAVTGFYTIGYIDGVHASAVLAG